MNWDRSRSHMILFLWRNYGYYMVLFFSQCAPYNNHCYAIKRESCEIVTDPDLCNFMEHAQLHPSWRKILKSRRRGANNNVTQDVADEGGGSFESVSMKRIKRFFFFFFFNYV